MCLWQLICRSACVALLVILALPAMAAESGWLLHSTDGQTLDWQPLGAAPVPAALQAAWSHPEWTAGRWLCEQAMPAGWRRLRDAPEAAQQVVIAYRPDSAPIWRRWTALQQLLAPWSVAWRASEAGRWQESGRATAVPGLLPLPQTELDPTALVQLRLAIDGAALLDHLQEVGADALLIGGDRPLVPDGPSLQDLLRASRGLIELQIHPGAILPRMRLQLPESTALRRLLAALAGLPTTQSLQTATRRQVGL